MFPIKAGGYLLPIKAAVRKQVFAKRENNEPFDTVDSSGTSIAFNGERGKLSEDDYRKAFATSDEQYAAMLQALLAGLKKPS